MSKYHARDDEEDEDEEYDQPKSKKPRLSVSEFVDDEAEVDEEEEEEEEGDGELDNFVVNEEVEEGGRGATGRRGAPEFALPQASQRGRNRLSIDTLAQKYVNAPEGDDEAVEEDDEEDYETQFNATQSQRQQQRQYQYPTINDPKLFMVRCKIGKEREAVCLLMQKYLHVAYSNKEPLTITSALCLDELKGFIYVEAAKEAHVKQAIKGVANLSEFQMKLVPIKEMTHVLTPTQKDLDIQKGSFVRVKRGDYKGDLAVVEAVDAARGIVVIKLVPRLDTKGDDEKPEKGDKKKKKAIAPPKLFNKEEIEAAGGQVGKIANSQLGHGFDTYQGKKFHDGFLYKWVNIRSLDLKATPNLEEMQVFGSSGVLRRKTQFSKGDKVQVVEGELKKLIGEVLTVEPETDSVTILPHHEKIKHALKIPSSHLQKYFEVGSFVKVAGGKHDGETGHVVSTEGDTVILYSDLKKQEMRVFASDLQLASEVNSSDATTGMFSLHDLVQIDPQTVGVVVKVEKEVFKVLDNNGIVKTIKLQEMGAKRNQKSGFKIQDRGGQLVGVGDTIRVIDGPHKGRQGTVKHVFRQFLFCYARDMLEDSGIFVIRSKQAEIRGGKSNTPFAQPAPVRGRGMGRGGRMEGVKRRSHWLGKTVRITRGVYKGYIGIVKDCTDTQARIELHTHMKVVGVPVDNIEEIGAKAENIQTPTTARPQPTTPYGDYARTPLRDGSETPAHDSGDYARTPSHDVWNPKIANTPHRDFPTTPSNYGSTSYSPYPSGMHQSEPAYSSSSYYETPHQNTIHTPAPITPAPITPAPITPGLSAPITPAPTTPAPTTPAPITPAPTTPFGMMHPHTPMPIDHHHHVQTPMMNPTTPKPMSMYPITPAPVTPAPTTPAAYTPHTSTPSMHPMTPGVPHTPKPTTPQMGLGSYSTPMMGGMQPITPSVGGSISTPLYSPVEQYRDEHWAESGLEVRIIEGPYTNMVGVIQRVIMNKCQVLLHNGARVIDVYIDAITNTQPKKGDNVKIIKGQSAGAKGKLIAVEGNEGIVQVDVGYTDIKYCDLAYIAKFA